MNPNPFESMNIGKCNTCLRMKPLDEMVMQQKGLYHCTDCETEDLYEKYMGQHYDFFEGGKFNDHPIKDTRIKKLLGWCFG